MIFSVLCVVEEGSDSAALLSTWCPVRVSPPLKSGSQIPDFDWQSQPVLYAAQTYRAAVTKEK